MSIISAYIRRGYRGFRGEVLVLPSRTIVVLFCLTLFLLPLITTHPYYLRILIMASIFALFAASWDLLSGFTGQISFGHALFFGVAAYTSALLNLNIGLPTWLTIPLGALAAVLAGLVIGVPCLRLRGAYLALATLAFPLILTGIVFVIPDITGGELGVSGIDRLSGSRVIEYYIVIALMVTLGFVMWKIADSKTGIIFHAIREDELTARASGINTTKYKLLAFCLSGLFAGVAGGLYILVLLMEFLTVKPEIRMLVFAIVVLLLLLFMPQGLTTWVRDKTEKVCPRCKLRNIATRKSCRVCTADLD